MQVRVVRIMRDNYDPLTVPKRMQSALAKGSDEVIELPMKPDAEPFLLYPFRLTRRFEFERGWLSGRVNGREVRFTLTPAFVEFVLQFHDPTVDIEMEEREEAETLAKLREEEGKAELQQPD